MNYSGPPPLNSRTAGYFHRLSVQGRYPVLDGELHQGGHVADAQLLHHAAAIGVDALRGDAEQFGHFRAGVAFDDQLQDLAFTTTQALHRARRVSLPDVVVDY